MLNFKMHSISYVSQVQHMFMCEEIRAIFIRKKVALSPLKNVLPLIFFWTTRHSPPLPLVYATERCLINCILMCVIHHRYYSYIKQCEHIVHTRTSYTRLSQLCICRARFMQTRTWLAPDFFFSCVERRAT